MNSKVHTVNGRTLRHLQTFNIDDWELLLCETLLSPV